MGNECNVEKDESILASMNDSTTENDSDYGSISTNNLEDIWYETRYINTIKQDMIGLKYTTMLYKREVNGKEQNSHPRF